jgi:hypothetical protein
MLIKSEIGNNPRVSKGLENNQQGGNSKNVRGKDNHKETYYDSKKITTYSDSILIMKENTMTKKGVSMRGKYIVMIKENFQITIGNMMKDSQKIKESIQKGLRATNQENIKRMDRQEAKNKQKMKNLKACPIPHQN